MQEKEGLDERHRNTAEGRVSTWTAEYEEQADNQRDKHRRL